MKIKNYDIIDKAINHPSTNIIKYKNKKCHDIQTKIIKTQVSFSEAIPINYKTHTHYETTNIFTVVN